MERATLERYHHFHSHSGMCAQISQFELFCFSSLPGRVLISVPRGLCQKYFQNKSDSATRHRSIYAFHLYSNKPFRIRRHRLRVRPRSPLKPILYYGQAFSDIYHMSSLRPAPRNGDSRLQYPWGCLCGKGPSPACYSESSVEYGTKLLSNCRGTWLMGIGATWPAKPSIRLLQQQLPIPIVIKLPLRLTRGDDQAAKSASNLDIQIEHNASALYFKTSKQHV